MPENQGSSRPGPAGGALAQDMQIKCNGVKAERYKYDDANRDLAIKAIEAIRAIMIHTNGRPVYASRFMSNGDVYDTLTSACPEEEFKVYPFSWARAALEDCRERDAYYATKGWDEPIGEPEPEDTDE